MCVDEEGTAWAVPIVWTDLNTLSLEQVISAGRAVALVDDLMDLAALVARVHG